jgi:hypothetical protein
VVALLAVRGSPLPDVKRTDNPYLPARGPLIRDQGRLEDAAKAWKDGQGGSGIPDIDPDRTIEALWAGRAPGGDEVVALGQYGRAVLVRRTGGDWSVAAGARRVSSVAPVSFGGAAVLVPGNSGSRLVSARTDDEIATGRDRLVDGMVLPPEGSETVSRGLVPPDRRYGVLTAFGKSTADSATVAYKVTGPRDDTRIGRLIRAGHVVGLYEALYPGDQGVTGGGTGIGQVGVLADGSFGRLGHGVAVSHSRNSPANTVVSVGFDRPDRQAELLGTGQPPFVASDRRPLFGAGPLSTGGPPGRAPLVIAGDARIRRYDVYRGARRTTVGGPIAVLAPRGPGVTAVIGHTAGGAPVLPVGN